MLLSTRRSRIGELALARIGRSADAGRHECPRHKNWLTSNSPTSGVRKLNRAGDVVLTLQGENILLHAPVIYQGAGNAKRSVNGRCALAGNRVSFQIGAYDHTQSLVIDPVVTYLT